MVNILIEPLECALECLDNFKKGAILLVNREPNGLELSLGAEAFVKDVSIGKELSNRAGKKVAILGGGGISADSPYYKEALKLGRLLASAGVSVITGGGPGIMEAGNKGAKLSESHSASYGLKVNAIKGEHLDGLTYFDDDGLFEFNTLAVRLLSLISNSDAVVFFPGGYGTLEELFSLVVRMRVNIMNKVPVYLFGSEYWNGLVAWLTDVVLPNKTINKQDLDLFSIEDDVENISNNIINYCSQLN